MAGETIDLSRRAVEGGFADPVFDAQAVFAAILRAMARPGTVVDLGHRAVPPAPLSPAQGAILSALADQDTPVFVEGVGEALAAWLGFQTGARLAHAAEARFAVVSMFGTVSLERFALGTLAFPDRSATLLLEVASLKDGPTMRLSGPGISGSTVMQVSGLGEAFLEARRANRALLPCGLDLILTSGTLALCLPRSTVIEEA
ncbi:phosphonate C-P lyase system protein PhnH [Jiella endophytica]|uniref:Phosphonate C-P lyase system protein PhnH n=1 Tax=Jiella endophytica TaxID=2558362 RepID=A0A4Y8RNL1_9HYPH|nr:phosphonate C-P lyase system protein PhnH [Jiella endophytica]TFF24891.1 phosphonate C-P lyase system protein PhnH [Jiella endophytica]